MAPPLLLPFPSRRSCSLPPKRIVQLNLEAQPAHWNIDLVDGWAAKTSNAEVVRGYPDAGDDSPKRAVQLEGFGKNLAKEGKVRVPAGRPVQLFDAQFERSEGQCLGAMFQRWSLNSIVIIRIKQDGLISRWNSDNPQQQICTGDLINKVLADDKAVMPKDMPKALEATTRAKLVVGIGRKGGDGVAYYDVCVQKHARFQRLGLEFLLAEDDEVQVKQVLKEGPVWKWNTVHPDTAVHVGDALVAVNDVVGGDSSQIYSALEGPKTIYLLTFRRPRSTEWLKGLAPNWSLDVALAPKAAITIEQTERELLALNTSYTERSEGFDVNGRETYWSADGHYYIYFNSLREWSIGKAEHFNLNRGSLEGGRRYALAVSSAKNCELRDAVLSEGWLQWDMLKGQWAPPGQGTGVSDVSVTKSDELRSITVILPGGREQTVHVGTLANLKEVAKEVQKRLKVVSGKELRFRQGGKELEMGTRVLRISPTIPLEAGVFTSGDASLRDSSPDSSSPRSYVQRRSLVLGSPQASLGKRVSSPRAASPRAVRRGMPNQWLKIPCEAVCVDGLHLSR